MEGFAAFLLGIIALAVYLLFRKTKQPSAVPATSSPTEKVVPFDLAETFTDFVVQQFSRAKFHEIFDEHPFSEAWSISDALVLWYCLGYWCFVVGLASEANADPQNVEGVLGRGVPLLVRKWNLTPSGEAKFKEFWHANHQSVYAAYQNADNSHKYAMFFGHFVNKILGNDVAFTDTTRLEGLLRGADVNEDPILGLTVSQHFVSVLSELRNLSRQTA